MAKIFSFLLSIEVAKFILEKYQIYIYIYIYIFDPSFGNLACLATLKSCETTKQSICG